MQSKSNVDPNAASFGFRSIRRREEKWNLSTRRMKEKEKNLFQFIQDAICFGEIPVEEELVDDGEIVAGFGEAREELIHVALRLLLDQAPKPREEPGLAGRAFESGGAGFCG